MKILTFDIGANLGWAVGHKQPGDSVFFGSTGCELFFGSRVEKLSQALEAVRRIVREFKPDTVVYEKPFARGMAATRSLWGYAGIVEAVATTEGCAVLDVNNQTIKRHMAGSGKATKIDMVSAVNKILGAPVDNEHTADAVALLDYAARHIEGVSQ